MDIRAAEISSILKEQDDKSKSNAADMIENLHFVKELGIRSRRALEAGDLQCFGHLMHEQWEQKIANGTPRWVAYHTLFFTDFYLSPGESAFVLRPLHAAADRGVDGRLSRLVHHIDVRIDLIGVLHGRELRRRRRVQLPPAEEPQRLRRRRADVDQ